MAKTGKKLSEMTIARLTKFWVSNPDLSAATIGKIFGITGDTVARYMVAHPREMRTRLTGRRPCDMQWKTRRTA